jgi:hypothetical protein
MVEAVPHLEALDSYLKDIIQAVYGATSSGSAHLRDDPSAVERAIADSKEVLDTVMEGHVDEWIAA